LPNIKVIGHDELYSIKEKKPESVSISAFDPKRKIAINRSSNFISEVCSLIPKHCKVIYFSTARILDNATEPRHAAYVENKVHDEIQLRAFFDNVSIVYLPLIIPQSREDKNFFIETFFKNLKSRSIVFDVSLDSSWNFIHPSDLKIITNNINKLTEKQLLINKKSFTGHDFVSFAKQLCSLKSITYGDKIVRYPEAIKTNVMYGEYDFFSNYNWLKVLDEIYG
tara:strand:- start:2637 stop:3308 length:672 start_codon:yes stop_codon:yes gene_type:complete